MSYASVAANNAPPPSEQPKPDPALLNTVPDNDTAKANTILNDARASQADEHLEMDPEDNFPPLESTFSRSSKGSKRLKEAEAEGLYLWETAKHYLIRPGVGCGILGLVNIGLLASVGRTFYLRPHLRRDATAISSALAATVALISIEGFAAKKYHQTSRGQEEVGRAKKEGTLIFHHAYEQIMRPKVLGGVVGIINTAVLGTLGYFSFVNWDKKWDRQVVSTICIGLLALWGGEGFVARAFI
ncbi:hypothetical protein M413DRAFT_441669 [Hebeloma cylindrosporum]|uniref:Uncharacterized protein n=1 Tax=Hebeloma cylindrosporum TaxID=76867 RepID=A0A0C3C859_HEBCY|nr:hypothetical protein M413DRAFT_441669 [Hebeloma cylindrosporum h7]